MDWNQKVVMLTGMWLASMIGAVYGLLFTIIGAGLDWGTIIFDVAIMSLIFGLPFYIIAGVLNALVAAIVLKK